MANLYVTGPVHIFVSLPVGTYTGTSGAFDPAAYPTTIYYLGTGEQAPIIQISPLYSPVGNDIAGDQIPFDDQYMGKTASAVVTLTRWNEAVAQALSNMPNSGDSVPGIDAAMDTGSLMQFEGGTFHTWFQFPYATKQFGTLFGMPAQYHFPACTMMPWTLAPGTKAKKRLFQIDAKRAYRAADAKFYLYDNLGYGVSGGTALPSIPPTAATGLVT